MTRETIFNSVTLAALAIVPLWAHFSGEPFTVTLATRAVIACARFRGARGC